MNVLGASDVIKRTRYLLSQPDDLHVISLWIRSASFPKWRSYPAYPYESLPDAARRGGMLPRTAPSPPSSSQNPVLGVCQGRDAQT